MVLLIGFKADINLKDEVTRGKGWECVARAGGLYTLCTNLHAYSADTARRSLHRTTLRPRLIFILLDHSITGPWGVTLCTRRRK